MKQILYIIIALLFTSCEKTIELDYNSNQSKLIIEGNITDQPGPYFVKITKSLSLTDIENYPTINNAIVTISDNAGTVETLVAQGNGIYRTNILKGTIGRTYTLTVKHEDQNYVAQSTMPQQVPFNDITIEEVVFGGDTEYSLIPIYKDPTDIGNNYRFVLSVNSKLINQHFVQNDEVKNGIINTQKLEINDGELKIKSGDMLEVEMQCIDNKAALFYNTLALIGNSGPGGGTTPNNPPSNLSGGAMGLFSAHTVQKLSKKVP